MRRGSSGRGPVRRRRPRSRATSKDSLMKKLAALFILALAFSASASAITFDGLERIGPVSSFARNESAVVLNCQDNSQVVIRVLAPDLVRVRASFRKPMPERDHSWAIDRTSWETPRWNVREESGLILIATDELEVAVRRSPLLIEFRDAKTHEVINADERPMMYDPKGTTV